MKITRRESIVTGTARVLGSLESVQPGSLFAADDEPATRNKSGKVTLLHVNDVHGYMDLHLEWFAAPQQPAYRQIGGYARIATIVKQIREETEGRVLFCDNGDTFHGTYAVVKTEGEALLPILNQLGLAAMTVHWDFFYGPAQLQNLASKLKHPILAINIYDKKGKLFFQPYVMQEVGGLKIATIGIGSNIVDKLYPAEFSEGIRCTDGLTELPGFIKEVRGKGADLVVVLSHLGFPQDMELLSKTPGVDVLISGHTHNRLWQPVKQGGALLMQSGCHGAFVGRLDLEVQDGKVVSHQHALIEVAESIRPDPTMEALVKEALKPYAAELGRVVGQVSTVLDRDTELEATMDNFLLASIRELAGTTLAFSNGWRWGAPVLPGPVTQNDVWNIVPWPVPISTADLTGRELIEMLEENLERTYSAKPFDQQGGYVKRCHGLKMYIKIENPPGTRIQDLFIAGERVQPDKTYSTAFLTVQAVPEKYGKNRKNLTQTAHDAMLAYLAKHSPASAELVGSVVAN